MKLKAPIEGSPSIVPILNVAWEAYNKLPKFWPPKDDEERDDDKLDDILKDIVLKSIEIFEIEQILG
ncbi:MAG: hypothetical protein NTY09_05395 [bacterium]|nr:hypothetical protein [bacterium]